MPLVRLAFNAVLALLLADSIATLERLKVYPKATRVFEIIVRAVIGVLIVKAFS